MKTMKKFMAVAIVAVMTMALVVTAGATNVTITSPTGGDTGSTYTAWELLTATPDPTQTPETYTYKINPKYASALQAVTKKTTDADVYAYIKALGADDSANVQAFAKSMYDQVKNMPEDASLTTGTASSLGNGYWLIAETTIGNMPDGQTAGVATRILLDTAGTAALNITAKESYPTPDKKITAVSSADGSVKDADSATAKIGDIVTFELKTTLPANFTDYNDGYILSFNDTLSDGLTYVETTSVKVDGQNALTTGDGAYTFTQNGQSLTYAWADISKDSHAGNSVDVVITYTARVNANAKTGTVGNANTLNITYSNNPNDTGTGNSKDKEVKVYTFKLVVEKKNESNAALAGAGFVLKNADGAYYKFTPAEGTTPASVTWVTDINQATEYTSGDNGKLDGDFTGLPEGTFTLVEKTVPASYNKANDITFSISAAKVDADDTITVTLTTTDNEVAADANYDLSTTVVNQKGVELPSTGGIGTKIFYTMGAVLVIGAGVVLVSRKRAGE